MMAIRKKPKPYNMPIAITYDQQIRTLMALWHTAHMVFVSSGGDVFPNFELDGSIDDPRDLGKQYNKDWTHIVKFTKDITIESSITR